MSKYARFYRKVALNKTDNGELLYRVISASVLISVAFIIAINMPVACMVKDLCQ